ncbi:hypothetical protein GCM10010388_74830 [Streptomyces mauvecolor]
MLRMGRAVAPAIALSGLLMGTVTGTANAADQTGPTEAFHVKVSNATQTSLQMEFALPKGDHLAVKSNGELAVQDARGKELDAAPATIKGGGHVFSGKWAVSGDTATLNLASVDGHKIAAAGAITTFGFSDWLSCVSKSTTASGTAGAVAGCVGDAVTGCAPGAVAGGVAGGIGGAVAGAVTC